MPGPSGGATWSPPAANASWWSTTSPRSSTPWPPRSATRGSGSTRRSTGRLALAAAQESPPDLIVLDVMLPDLDGLEVTRRLRADGHPGAHPLPHRPGRGRGQGGRAHRRRRRLRDQAVRPGRDRGPGARHPAPHRQRARGRGHPPVRRHRDGRERPRGDPGRPVHLADRHRVQPAPLLPPQSPPRAVQVPDPRPRVALRLRRGRQRGRDLRQLPAQEARGGRPSVIHTVRLVGYALREPAAD